MTVKRSVETQLAVHDEQIAQLTRRIDALIKFWIAVLLAALGAGISFLFIALSQATH